MRPLGKTGVDRWQSFAHTRNSHQLSSPAGGSAQIISRRFRAARLPEMLQCQLGDWDTDASLLIQKAGCSPDVGQT